MKKRLPLVILAIAAVGVGVYAYIARNGDEQPLRLSGVVEAREVHVGSKVGGRVKEVAVEEGQMVEPGQLLVRFDASELEAERAQVQAGIASAQALLAKLERGYRPEEIQQAEAAVRREQAALEALKEGPRKQEIAQAEAEYNAARAEAANAETDLARAEQLYKTGDVARQVLDDTRTRRNNLNARAEAVRQRLVLLKAGTRGEDIRAGQARLRQAQANAEMLRKGYRKEDIADARAKLSQAKAQMEQLLVRLAEMEVLAPSKARVEAVSVRPGDLAPPGKPVATLLELSQVWVRVYVPEPELGALKVGQQVDVEVDTYPGRQFSGTIEQIASRAEFLPRNIQTRDDRNHQVFGVKVGIDNKEGVFKAGMAATVTIHPASSEVGQAFSLPLEFLHFTTARQSCCSARFSVPRRHSWRRLGFYISGVRPNELHCIRIFAGSSTLFQFLPNPQRIRRKWARRFCLPRSSQPRILQASDSLRLHPGFSRRLCCSVERAPSVRLSTARVFSEPPSASGNFVTALPV